MIYWTTTVLASLFLLLSAISYLVYPAAIRGFRELGFPDFFRIELVVLKVLAAVVLMVPFVPTQVKEWAYAGAALFGITAIVAHHAHGDPYILNLVNIIFLAVLFTSNIYLPR